MDYSEKPGKWEIWLCSILCVTLFFDNVEQVAEVLFHFGHQLKLGAAALEVLARAVGAKVEIAVQVISQEANAAFQRFADAGMHIVRSTDPIARWPGIRL